MKKKAVNARSKENRLVSVIVDIDTDGRDLQPGDKYVAKRNHSISWVLLTCNSVNLEGGWVVPDGGYCFDLHECSKVVV